jgi:NitT/TauT family transport system substrate-binding protein
MASGIDVRIVAPMARQDPGASSTYLMVRKDLIDSGRFASYGDLRGKRIGVAGTPNYILARTLQHAGLEPESVEPVDLGTDFQAMTAALTTGAIDAASQPEPTATLTTHAGAGVKWREVSDVAPGLQLTVVLFGPGLRTRPDIAQRWMAAYLRGVRDYHDAFIKNGPGRDDIIDILARSTPVTDPLLYRDMGFPYIDPNGQPNQDSLSDQLQFAQTQGLLTGALDIQDVVDTQYAEAAVEHLGRYQA